MELNEISYKENMRRKKAHLDMSGIERHVKNMKRPEPVYTNLGPMPNLYQYDMNGFLQRFATIGSMPDNELVALVRDSYCSVLDAIDLLSKTPDASTANPDYVSLIGLFTDSRYITILTNILRSTPISINHKIVLNKVIYNYLTMSKKDTVIEDLMMNLGRTINSDIIPILMGRGLDQNLATNIAVASASSMDDYINVRRVNLCIFNCGSLEIMNLQMIVDIYQNIFNRCMTILFKGIMFDVYSENDLKNATESQREIYSLMLTAVLEMMNQMPSSSIRSILTSYCMDYTNYPKPIRCSLNLSQDYYRINEVIDIIRISDGMYIP